MSKIINIRSFSALTADIVSSHVANNTVAVSDLPVLIDNVYSALAKLGGRGEPVKVKQEPAVSIRASIKPDHIVCLEDGKKLKMLKRHLMTHYNLTPDQYRALEPAADYPMVAPNYAQQRPRACQEDRPRHQTRPQALDEPDDEFSMRIEGADLSVPSRAPRLRQ